MRALVVGASGQVGTALMSVLQRRGHEATGTYYTHPVPGYYPLDLNDQAKARSLVYSARPDWIFCPAGMTQADRCEEHPEEARRQIVEGPLAVASLARETDAGFFFYSSAYVFGGKAGPYGEEDSPSPLNVYGQCKWEAEQAIQAKLDRWVIVRTVVVYGPEPQEKNFVCQVVRNARSGVRMPVAVDQISNTTYNEDLARASVELAERGKLGIYHLAGPDSLDRYSFARMVCSVFDLDPGFLDSRTTAELSQRAPRPLDARLRIEKASADLVTRLTHADEGLKATKASLQAMTGTR
jgi:dTDP-4-dehydrorhamnose reductase